MTTFTTTIEKEQLNITSDNLKMTISGVGSETGDIFLYFKEKKIQEARFTPTETDGDYDQVAAITVPFEIEKNYLAAQFQKIWTKNKLTVEVPATIVDLEIPKSQQKDLAKAQKNLFAILILFGYPMAKVQKKPAKAAHRWNQEVAKVEFSIDWNGSTGTAIWEKRDQLRLLKGAKLTREMPLNKDGSVGYSAKFTEMMREKEKDAIEDFTTTQDLVFKSVNELGIFLYYANTNGWLVLKDADGKTIDEYTVVK
ncbi:DUF4357 domain-containing protein [Enterococcus timonensis]|uniref:DUF4357 domain-containing protein n=1 Tax=Enterococcus timonensis TaxID=1852364 RepID=UPI0008D97D86|nr:DUF4357 domain-containing protein [Enterococcus timonensis]